MFDSIELLAPLLSAFVIGLMGAAHCLGMCGGIMAALSFSVPAEARGRRVMIVLSYNMGRLASYTFIGLLAGLLGVQLAGGHGLSVLRVIAALLLIAMGLYLADWWRGLTYLEKVGGYWWRLLQPLSKRLMPVKSAGAALLLGSVWGWLPCGLVYTALAYALAQGDGVQAALVMLAFGLGTLPAVFLGGVMAEQSKAVLQRKGFRVFMALLIITFGIWTLFATLQHAQHVNHGAHDEVNQPMDHSHHHH